LDLRHLQRDSDFSAGFGKNGDPAYTLTSAQTGGGNIPAVAFAQNQRNEVRQMDMVGALAAEPGMKQTAYIAQGGGMEEPQYVVRRITPIEAERLQGFPDGWTDIEYNGRPAPDTLRYKALGNSMTVNVMRWLAERILEADKNGD
jgi:DNA (cytosine-5)-methyltransferase 1